MFPARRFTPGRLFLLALVVAAATAFGAMQADPALSVYDGTPGPANYYVKIQKVNGGSGRVTGYLDGLFGTERYPNGDIISKGGTKVIDCPGDCSEENVPTSRNMIYFVNDPAPGSTAEWAEICTKNPPEHGGTICGEVGGTPSNQQLHMGCGCSDPITLTVKFSGPDTTDPKTTITSHPRHVVRSAKLPAGIRFAFKSSEADSTFQCGVDGRPYRSCSSPKVLKLGAGDHRFRVRAIDEAGNKDASPADFNFSVARKR